MSPQHQVFHRIHIRKQFDILECTGDAPPRNSIRFFALDLPVLENNSPGTGTIDPVDTIKKGGFSRAIWANNGENGALLDLKCYVFEGLQTSK